MKDKLNALLEDKATLIFILSNMALGILFWIGTFFTFLTDPMIINGKLSLSDLPGSFIVNLVILVTVFAYGYGMLEGKDKLCRRMLLIQVIVATLFHLYGALLFRVGSEGSASGAFGRIYLFFFLVLMWVNYIRPGLIKQAIQQFYVQENRPEVESNE